MRVPPDPRPSIPGSWPRSDMESSHQHESRMDSEGMNVAQKERFRLLDLPSELIDHILTYLSPPTLARISRTCKTLATLASADRLWKEFLTEDLPQCRSTCQPFNSWKEMYGSQYPYWFLPKHKIWFADKTALSNPLTGQLMLVRYDHRIGCIEGYRLRAEHPDTHMFFLWTHDSNVRIHLFEPRVSMFLDDPIIKLDRESFDSNQNRLQQEVPLAHNSQVGNAIRARIFPTVSIPPRYRSSSMSLWPPSIIPAPERVRSESPSHFEGSSHKPSTLEEMSTTTFRIRKWLAFSGLTARLGLRTAEDVITYSTILPEYYTPTAEKPYQGLWIGDYSGHGVEFLLVIQSSAEEAQRMNSIEEDPAREDLDILLPGPLQNLPRPNVPDIPGHSGRLDAIKLTGDPNVPRGQLSWVAEDISCNGLLRIADEPEFRGARVVKSHGHIAQNGFREDRYTPGQLFLLSEDSLAQYWVEMGHISFFQRINIDEYLQFPSSGVEQVTRVEDGQ